MDDEKTLATDNQAKSTLQPKDAPGAEQNDPKLLNETLASQHTSNFPDLLGQLGISLLVTTYQAGRLIAIRNDNGVLNTHFRIFPKPMGLAATSKRFCVGTAAEIKTYKNVPAVCNRLAQKPEDVAEDWQPPQSSQHDACYVPFESQVTGDIDIHEMDFDKSGRLWFINTRFSTLCTRDNDHSFIPHWRPKFVSALTPEDRCHLNGLAMRDGKPRYVSALGATDTAGGWRENKANGGVLIDLNRNSNVVAGLSMPHSPRWYNGKLWILESGLGTLSTVDPATGKLETVAQLPGFTRGLCFHGPLAFIGLSQVREKAVFSGLPITEKFSEDERACGIWVVNILTGETVAFLRFTSGVREIFAVSVVSARFPEIMEPDNKLIFSTYVVPDEALKDVPQAASSSSRQVRDS